MRFCSQTLGCKVNQYETQAVESILISRGHVRAQPGDGCDICIINTCAVTEESLRKSRQAIRRMIKNEPNALIAVSGCFSQLDPLTVASLGADIIGGSGDRQSFALEIEKKAEHKMQNPEQGAGTDAKPVRQNPEQGAGTDSKPVLQNPEQGAGTDSKPMRQNSEQGAGTDLERKIQNIECFVDEPSQRHAFEELIPGASGGRTRALLKIQDGCDNYCAYCVIPYARGRARSLPLHRAAEHARMLDEQGFREIVITGIEISSYGKDLAENTSLDDTIRIISRSAPRARLRLGSLDPGAITEKFCNELSMIPNLCDHFHISLQSGCDDTLRRMRRKYDTNTVYKAISLLRKQFPDCGLTADLIVGFPGETEAEFKQTLEFIKIAAFSNMHIFPYSPRPGTPAADMPEQVAKSVKRERARVAALEAGEMARGFKLAQIGKIVKVLFEHKRDDFWTGHSGNYLEITVKDDAGKNSVHSVRIISIDNERIWGEISDRQKK